MLTLKEFIETKEWSDNGDGVDFFDGQCWIYAAQDVDGRRVAGGFIEFHKGHWILTIGNQSWAHDYDLKSLERRLYALHYLDNAGIWDICEKQAAKYWDETGSLLIPIQKAIGQNDGGFASIFFSDIDHVKEWNSAPTNPEQIEINYEKLREYVNREIMGEYTTA